MNKIIRITALVAFTLAVTALAQAQATRTWVSGVGDDVNPCSRTAPCKTFAGAISKTATGGEINAIDSGGFGTITITKAITIDGAGVHASILFAGTNGVVINALDTSNVTLRNLSLNGAGSGVDGVRVLQAGTVAVENCVIANGTGDGIEINETSNVELFVRDTVIRNFGEDGIESFTSAGAPSFAKVVLEHSSFINNSNGYHGRSQTRMTARNCVFSHNTSNGVLMESVTGGQFAVGRVWASQMTLNGSNGVQSGNGGNAGTSIVELAQNQISNNNQGVLISTGGQVQTFSNNAITGNNTDGCAGCSPVGPGN